jgi:hypothetical protein
LPGDARLPVLEDEVVQRSQLIVERLHRHAIPWGLTLGMSRALQRDGSWPWLDAALFMRSTHPANKVPNR